MVLDALRAYVQLASGVTEESRQRAVAAARSVLAQTPSVDAGSTGQLQQQVLALAEDVMMTSRANRELLLGLIRTEVERALSRLGIASADEVDALRRSVERLERLVREQRPPTAAAAAATPGAAAAPTAASRTAASRTAATRTAATSKAEPRKRATTKTAAGTTSTTAKAGSVTKAAGGTVVSGTERPRARRASRPTDEASPSRRARQRPAAAASRAGKKTSSDTATSETAPSETATSDPATSDPATSDPTTSEDIT